MSEQKDFAMIGDIRIADNVIATIAAIAITEIDGATLASSSPTSDLRELIVKSKSGRGIKVQFSEEGIRLDIPLMVRYGMIVADVAKQVQDTVVNAVESMTSLHVSGVNVSIVGVSSETK